MLEKEYFRQKMKKFWIILGISILIWVISIVIQGITLYKVKLNLFSGSICEITGFPLADCIYSTLMASIIQLANITFWFWVIKLLWWGFNKARK